MRQGAHPVAHVQGGASTPVETYLRQRRKITSPLPATVRYLPPLKSDHHPAMIVPYGLPQEPEPGVLEIAESAIAAVQLTLLKADGSDKADVKPNKITIASPAGRPMVLAPVSDLFALVICEGVEDALSVHLATGLGAWAAGGGSFLPKLAADRSRATSRRRPSTRTMTTPDNAARSSWPTLSSPATSKSSSKELRREQRASGRQRHIA